MPAQRLQTLGDIVEPAGYTISEVAQLTQLEESTVSRLWNNDRWLDSVKGSTLQKLIAFIPGVAEYTTSYPLHERRETIQRQLEELGLELSSEVIKRHISQEAIPEQYILHSVEAGARLVSGRDEDLDKHLTKFWGKTQDQVLSYLFTSDPRSALLRDNRRVIEAAHDAAERLSARRHSYHAVVACATLVHHVAKATGQLTLELGPAHDRQSAFLRRSAAMGRIINTNDLDIVRGYAREVESERVLTMIEEWALPTYCRDTRPTQDFSIPRNMSLVSTSEEVLREIEAYNDAYFYYLVTIYIPLALSRDVTFGTRIGELSSSVEKRLERCAEPDVREAAIKLLRDMNAKAQ